MAIDEKKLKEEIESLTMHITGLRAGRGVLNEFMKQYRESILRIIDEQPKTEWIPCEERLPECESGSETEELLYQLKGTNSIEVGYYGEGGYYRNRYFRTYRDSFEGVDVSDVIAWQPLPQAYKKEGAE